MNSPESTNTFKPKQAITASVELYDELVGDGMEQLAKITIAQIPAIPAGAVIHDNGCGTGAATAAAIAACTNPEAQITIVGTDIDKGAVNLYSKRASDKSWPATCQQMDAQALTFPDGKFTHSIGNAMIFTLGTDGIDAAKEMYRTLQPGGICIINSFAITPTVGPIQAASRATRPSGTPVPREGLDKWSAEQSLRDVLEAGGFSKDKINVVREDVYTTTPVTLKHFSTMMWSFVGGTSKAGWLKTDEERWDEAILVLMEEFRKGDGFEELQGGGCRLKFVANIAIASK